MLDNQTERKKDPASTKVMARVQKGSQMILQMLHLSWRIIIKTCRACNCKKILTRPFFDNVGKVSHKQVCIPKHLSKELFYRVHNSPTGCHFVIVRTTQGFPKRFYSPGFSEFLAHLIKNCFSCLTLKQVNTKHFPLQPISSEQRFPSDMMQIDRFVPFQSPIYKCAHSGIDLFSKNLFAVLLTSADARSLANYQFQFLST